MSKASRSAAVPKALAMSEPLAQPLAAIDLGSNSFRLEIGRLQHGRYRRIAYLKDMVRLGAGLDGAGMLTPDAAERGLACLRRFAHRLRGFAPAQVRAVATQTLREAKNRNAFLEHAQAVLGFPIEVISGREEARLIYAGVSHMQPGDEHRLVLPAPRGEQAERARQDEGERAAQARHPGGRGRGGHVSAPSAAAPRS